MVRDKIPLTSQGGIKIGPWKTTINGVYVDTFLLGGDSAVRFREGSLYLDGRRVIPLSFLAERYPETVEKPGSPGAGRSGPTPGCSTNFTCCSGASPDSPAFTEEGAGPGAGLWSRGPFP